MVLSMSGGSFAPSLTGLGADEADGFVQGDDDARLKGEGITSYELRVTNYKRGKANERRSDEGTEALGIGH